MAVDQAQDSAIIQAVLSGRHEAFEALVARYFETVRMVALAKTANMADAEDVAQETFLKAYESLGALRNQAKLAPWLVVISRNLAVSVVRRRERERRLAPEAAAVHSVQADHEQREFHDGVARHVETLPESLREVVLLYYFEGLRTAEIAERLELSANAVVKRLARGREVLGDRLLRAWGADARRGSAARGVRRIMGAVAVLPQPDWNAPVADLAVPGAAKAGSVWQVGSLIVTKTMLAEVALVVAAMCAGGYYIFHELRPVAKEAAATADDRGADRTGTGRAPTIMADSTPTSRTPPASEDFDGPIRIPIEPPPPQTEVGYVAGNVVDQDGAPVRDAQVWAMGNLIPVGGMTHGQGAADPNGAFRIHVSAPRPTVDAGEVSRYVYVTCNAPGYASSTAPDVRLNTSGLRIVLMRPALIAGKVVDAASGAPVQAFQLSTDGPYRHPDTGEYLNPQRQEFTSVTGEFRLEAPYGIEKLHVTAPGFVRAEYEIGVGRGDANEALVLALDRGGEIHLLLFDKATRAPLESPRVAVAARVDGNEVPVLRNVNVAGDHRGGFTIAGVPRGVPLTLEVDAAGYASEVVPDLTADSRDPIQIYLGRGGTLSGRVWYHGGPPPGSEKDRIEEGYCRVDVIGHEGTTRPQATAYVRSDGTYEVTGLEPGLHRAQAFYWPSNNHSECYSISKLVVVRGDGVTRLDINFDEPSGQIMAELGGGEAAYDAIVELHTTLEGGAFLESRTTRPEQSRDIPRNESFPKLESGDYVLRTWLPGEEGAAQEQVVQVNAGQTTKVYLELEELDGTDDGLTPQVDEVEPPLAPVSRVDGD